MRVACLLGATAAPLAAQGAPPVNNSPPFAIPAWLYSTPAVAAAPVTDSVTLVRLPGSTATYTPLQLHDRFRAIDWYPDVHPPMPVVVATGRRPGVLACGYCHLPDGSGRPENAVIAGLPEEYIIRQLLDMRSGDRRSAWPGAYVPSDLMRMVADSVSDAELAEAAAYFAAIRPRPHSLVVETFLVPRPIALFGIYRPGTGEDSLGMRLITMPADLKQHEVRDSKTEYLTYVPPGSLARGRVLATAGASGAASACTTCHGPDLRGMGLIPPIAGRYPAYLLRQLLAFKTGTRSTLAGAPMRQVAEALSLEEMIAAAAYAGSLAP
jgi:cytochrome c553